MDSRQPVFPQGPVIEHVPLIQIFKNSSAGKIPVYEAESHGVPEIIRLHLRHQVPFVISNFGPLQALRKKWTESYFLEHFSQKRFNAMEYRNELNYVTPRLKGKHGNVRRSIKTLSQAYDLVQNKSTRNMLYLATAPFSQVRCT